MVRNENRAIEDPNQWFEKKTGSLEAQIKNLNKNRAGRGPN